MKPICTVCNTEISTENLNVATDIAKCQNCGNIAKLSTLLTEPKKVEFNPPTGSKIQIHKGLHNVVEITYPKKGFGTKSVPILIFSIFWLGFVAVWTFFAAMGSTIFALFSIPFWLVGIGMLLGAINSAMTVETVSINTSRLKILKNRLFRSKEFEADLKSIQKIELYGVLNNYKSLKNTTEAFSALGNNTTGTNASSPTVFVDNKQEYFFTQASLEEKEWICNLLNHLIEKSK